MAEFRIPGCPCCPGSSSSSKSSASKRASSATVSSASSSASSSSSGSGAGGPSSSSSGSAKSSSRSFGSRSDSVRSVDKPAVLSSSLSAGKSASASVSSGIQTPCCTVKIPSNLYVTVTPGGTFPMFYRGVSSAGYEWSTGVVTIPGCGTVNIGLVCGTLFAVGNSVIPAGGAHLFSFDVDSYFSSCAPLSFGNTLASLSGCAGTYSVVVTS